MQVKKYIKIYIILFKNWKYIFKIMYQTTSKHSQIKLLYNGYNKI